MERFLAISKMVEMGSLERMVVVASTYSDALLSPDSCLLTGFPVQSTVLNRAGRVRLGLSKG
jgi:hypothetical protein